MAIRRALGAGTRTLVGQLMVESVLVGLAGGLVGIGLATVGLRTFLSLNPSALPREAAVALDPRVFSFAVAVSLLTALVFGLLPALKAVRRDLAGELRGASRTSTVGRGIHTLRSGLVVAEVALSLVLVASAALLLRTFLEVQTQDPGFETADVWTVPLTDREVTTPDEYRLAMEDVRRSLEQVPGVQVASYGLTVPMEETGGSRCCWRSTVRTEDESAEAGPWIHPVSLGFFETFSIPILRGRAWSESDAGLDPYPAVLSENAAVELFGTMDAALGQSLTMNSGSMTVVGVAENTRHYGLDADPEPALYLPIEALPFPIPLAHMAVKMAPGAGAGAARSLRQAVWNASPNVPVPVGPLDGRMGVARDGVTPLRFRALRLLRRDRAPPGGGRPVRDAPLRGGSATKGARHPARPRGQPRDDRAGRCSAGGSRSPRSASSSACSGRGHPPDSWRADSGGSSAVIRWRWPGPRRSSCSRR